MRSNRVHESLRTDRVRNVRDSTRGHSHDVCGRYLWPRPLQSEHLRRWLITSSRGAIAGALGCIGLLYAVQSGAAPPGPAGIEAQSVKTGANDEARIADFARDCERSVGRLDGVRLSFTVHHYFHQGGVFNGDVGNLTKEDWLYDAEYETVKFGGWYRQERRYVSCREDLSDMVNRVDIHTWNGAVAASRTIHPGGEDFIALYDAPPPIHLLESHLSWQGWGVFQFRTDWTYADLARATCLGTSVPAEDVLEWTFKLPELGPHFLFTLSRRETQERQRLIGAEMRMYQNGPGADVQDSVPEGGGLRARYRIQFDWRIEGGGLSEDLAQGAVVVIEHYRPEAPESAFWAVDIIELHNTWDEPLLTAEVFSQLPGSNATVVDERYNLGYRVGDRIINFDGIPIEVEDSLQGDVGSRIVQVLEGAIQLEDTTNESPR